MVGSLSYAGLLGAASHPVQDPVLDGGGYLYKSGAQLPPRISATVTIAESAAGYATVITESSPVKGSRSVTYSGCPARQGVWWVGGFALWGRSSACVPIAVTTSEHPTPRRTVVSLGRGACAASSPSR